MLIEPDLRRQALRRQDDFIHDWASLLAYMSLPENFSWQLQRMRTQQADSAVRTILDIAHHQTEDTVEDQEESLDPDDVDRLLDKLLAIQAKATQLIPEANPKKPALETRYQVKQATIFNGGEGIWFFAGHMYFSTKGDNRIWSLNTETQKIKVIYDFKTSQYPVLKGVDNITVDNHGFIYVCEDGGDMQIVVLNESGKALPLLQIENQNKSEITGVAFTKDFKRMYFSSQRGPSTNGNLGITYEVSGPFEHIAQFFN